MAEDDRFYVKTLRMRNFRCFEDVELGPFDPQFNLLVGENGAGKSSVLLALAAIYSKYVRGYPVDFLHVFSKEDIQHSNSNNIIASGFELHSTLIEDSEEVYHSVQYDMDDRFEEGPYSEGRVALILSYDVRRLFDSKEYKYEYEINSPIDRHPAFEAWLEPALDASSLRAWVRDQTHLALQTEKRRRQRRAMGVSHKALQIYFVRDAVRHAVEGAAEFEYDAERQDMFITFENGSTQFFRSMSAGQKAFIGLFADIARRACLLNAHRFGEATLQETTGLVLIDEIDLHLHPKWQRQIVPALKKVFPKIQFFATTHSPQVIGECQPHEIVLLTPQGQKRPAGSFGMDSNWILECVMEAEGRDPAIARRLKALFDDIEDERFEEARRKLNALRRELGEGPDIVGAEAYLWRMEHLGDEAAE